MDPARIRPERQVAERLFEVIPGVWRIPVPTGFAVGDVNLYLVDGGAPVLVDTGVAGERTTLALADALAAAGRSLADVRTVVVTHAHVDHAGNAAAVQAASGCRVLVHPRSVANLRDPAGSLAAGSAWMGRFLRRSGFSEETVQKHAALGKTLRAAANPVPDPSPIPVGGEVHAGGLTLQAHETTGHSSDHVSFMLPGQGLMFTGDHVLPDISSNPTLEAPRPGDVEKPKPLLQFRESLARVAALPVRIACPAHGRPFTGLAERCVELLDLQAIRCARVRELLVASGPMTRKDISRALFGQVRLWDVYLTLSEASAAVEALVADGYASVDESGELDLVSAM